MDITAAHWVYLAGIVLIIAVMLWRKNVVVPAVAATFLTAWVFTGDFVNALTSVFKASLTAASALFSIFLIIALITALLGALRAMDADKRMIKPFRQVMRNARLAFVVIFLATYGISLFFWPTPAVPLIGAILLPAAIRAGMPAMAGAMAIAIAGQGMALSSDYIIQVAPGLSATSAGVATSAVADKAMVLSLITGGVAIVIAYLRMRRKFVKPDARLLENWERAGADGNVPADPGASDGDSDSAAAAKVPAKTSVMAGGSGGSDDAVPASGRSGAPPLQRVPDDGELSMTCSAVKRSKTFAALVPVAFGIMVIYMLLGKFTDIIPEFAGSSAAALVGGTAAILLLAASISLDGRNSLENCATHVVDGLVFAFKAMGIVIPIAGFFYIGNAEFAGTIMSLGEDVKPPSFLFDLVASIKDVIPNSPVMMGIGILLVGAATGLDGSGFSGLPLTGSLGGALGPASGVDPATLAAIGQMGSIWVGGGTLVAWSSLLAVAGFARVPVLELVRKLFIPVVSGLIVSTIIGIVIF